MGDDMFVILVATGGAIVRAAGVQVQSGHKGMLFHFGRATKVLDHGFRPLIPFFQTVTIVSTRSRTMDLPTQRVVNQDGLVYLADANLVYHVEDVRRAVVEI
ncbi:MAG: regulator of protease activity HflC (stomatin/prohibitin superfamily), partial [Glaciecola sp.]